MNPIEEYERTQERLDARLAELIEGDERNSWPELRRLDQRYGELQIMFRKMAQGEREREQLIALHCVLGPTYSPIHDKYHTVTEELLVEIGSGFGQIKTFLNTLAVFINKSLPQTQTRSLRFKGWGALVESATKTLNSGLPLPELRRLIAERGSDYEARFTEYRDKYLEHPHDLTDRSLSHGPTRITHTDGPASQPRRRSFPLDAPFHLIDELVVELSEGGRGHFFHVRSSHTNRRTINREPLGDIHDSSGAHFAMWGSHYHAFTTPDASADIPSAILKENQITLMGESPDIYYAMSNLLQITDEVVRAVAESRLTYKEG